MIDLAPQHLEQVRQILARHAPGCQVRAFGSRVTGRARRYSDLDLVLVSQTPLSWHALEALKDAFAESDLPFRVDVLDWRAISPEFRRIIEQEYVVVQTAQPDSVVTPKEVI